MRYEQICQIIFPLQIFEKVDDLRLDRHIQRGNSFITDDQLWLEDQRPGNSDTLPLTTGKRMGIAAQKGFVQSYLLNDFIHCLFDFPVTIISIVAKRLTDDIKHSHAGIKACVRILEDHLDVLTVFLQLCSFDLQEVNDPIFFRMEKHLTAGCLNSTDNTTAQCRFSAAGFTDDADGLPTVYSQRNIAQRFNMNVFSFIDLGQIPDFKQYIIHGEPPVFPV